MSGKPSTQSGLGRALADLLDQAKRGVDSLFCTTVVAATIMLGVVVDAVAVATRICFFGGVRLFCVCVEVSSLVRLGLSFFIPLLVGVVGVVMLFGELFMAVLWKNPAPPRAGSPKETRGTEMRPKWTGWGSG